MPEHIKIHTPLVIPNAFNLTTYIINHIFFGTKHQVENISLPSRFIKMLDMLITSGRRQIETYIGVVVLTSKRT